MSSQLCLLHKHMHNISSSSAIWLAVASQSYSSGVLDFSLVTMDKQIAVAFSSFLLFLKLKSGWSTNGSPLPKSLPRLFKSQWLHFYKREQQRKSTELLTWECGYSKSVRESDWDTEKVRVTELHLRRLGATSTPETLERSGPNSWSTWDVFTL